MFYACLPVAKVLCYIKTMKYLNAFNTIAGVGSQKLHLLMQHFGSSEAAWQASATELVESGISPALAEKIVIARREINPDAEWGKLVQHGIQTLAVTDIDYPALLKEISLPPYLLYVRGNSSFNTQPAIAVVGSRKFTSYGKQIASVFASDLVHAGVSVVSGLALGIDAIAHRGALDAGGHTIAVLGSSLEDSMIDPRENFNLSRDILHSGGALISEFPLGTSATPGTFPARNRIMAGMTLGTLVVEAAIGSGSLITANLAVECNREVFAVPGSIFSPSSTGTNSLIKSGAKMVTGVADILGELRLPERAAAAHVRESIPATPEEAKILNILSTEPLQVDRIIKLSTLDTARVGALLTIMEMKGLVKNIGGHNYIKL